MSFARMIRRGAFLNARFGVNGTQKAARSFGTDATGRVASDIGFLLSLWSAAGRSIAYSKSSPRAERRSALEGAGDACPHAFVPQYPDQLPHQSAFAATNK